MSDAYYKTCGKNSVWEKTFDKWNDAGDEIESTKMKRSIGIMW